MRGERLMSIHYYWYDSTCFPELTLSGKELKQAGFNSGDLFITELYNNGVILRRVPDTADLEKLFMETEESFYKQSADYVLDNGDIYLAGDYLRENGLNRQQLDITIIYGMITIRAKRVNFLA
ncbi:hypothetical protein OY11_18820 [Salmonella enterica]|nr:hypothetical protein [Salmonella enterica]